MELSVTTWNINSVRLRLPIVLDFLARWQPDILCLQETKTPDDQFPAKALAAAGYTHQAFIGQKGYNGVAILSKLPFSAKNIMDMCGKNDARHISMTLGEGAGAAAGLSIHNFYVPAGGDEPDTDINPKFQHKLDFLAHLRSWGEAARPTATPAILVGDLNIAPLEHDVWSHKQLLNVVSHTPIETEALETLREEAGWIDAARMLTPEPEKLYSWWSYRAQDWTAANRGRRLDHIWISPDLKNTLKTVEFLKEARGWERPSDHVPVTARLSL
ncbi:MAG: exodeoxyribonuclease III [Bosea sp. (in: a-proteobacteria)]